MKQIIFLVLMIVSSISTVFSQKGDSVTNSTMDTIKNGRDGLIVQNDTIFMSVKELAQLVDKKESKWNNVIPSLIAIIVVIISTGGAIYIGKRQLRDQVKLAEDQIRSQEAQAKEQLQLSREQIQETSKMNLAQVRANNISQARTAWIQELRENLSRFNGEVAIINFYLPDILSSLERGDEINAKKLYNDQIERIKTARVYAFKINLFLNKNEQKHVNLEELLHKYFTAALENIDTINENFSVISGEILDVSRDILKDAWEQAKNEMG
ncbi:MAG TPA: hypothetical protein PLE74_12315 [Candidatus Cloacimonadota bacterium]|nr:hypothetical protein [Candidatus Cloacimonadota bacterium]